MEPTILENIQLTLNPTRSRCEVLISANGSTTVLSSGLLKPFASHIKAVEEQLSSGSHLIKLDPRKRTAFLKLQRQKLRGYVPAEEEEVGADVDELISWFTRTTVERAVSFISSPGLIEHAVAIERELLHLEDSLTGDPSAAADYGQNDSKSDAECDGGDRGMSLTRDSSLRGRRSSSRSPSPIRRLIQNGLRTVAESNADEEGGELIMRIRKAMQMRLGMLRREQNVAVARAAAGGFTPEILSSLHLFADCFDCPRLKQACIQFSALLRRRELQANPPPAPSAVWVPLAPDTTAPGAPAPANSADGTDSGGESTAADAATGSLAIGTPVGGPAGANTGHGPFSFVPMYASGSNMYSPGSPFPYGLVAVAPGATAAAGPFPGATDVAGLGRGMGGGGLAGMGGGPPGAVRIGGKPVFGVHHHHYHRVGGSGRKNRAAGRMSPKLRSWANNGGAGSAVSGNGEGNGENEGDVGLEIADVSSARYYDSDSGLPGGRARGGGAGGAGGGAGGGDDMGVMSEAESFISSVGGDAMNGSDAGLLALGITGRVGSAGGAFAGSNGWSRGKAGGGAGGFKGGMGSLRRSGSGSLFLRPSAVAEGSDEFDDDYADEEEEEEEGAGPTGQRRQQQGQQKQKHKQGPQGQQQQQQSQLVLDPELMRRIQEVQLMQPGNQEEAEIQQQMLQDLLAQQQQQLQVQLQQQEQLLQQQQQIQQLKQENEKREEEKQQQREEEQRAFEQQLARDDWLTDPTTLAFMKQPNKSAAAGGTGAGVSDGGVLGLGGGGSSSGSDSGPFSDDFMLMSGMSASPSPDYHTAGGGGGAAAGGGAGGTSEVAAFDHSRSLYGGGNLEAEMLGAVAGAGAGGDSSARDFLGEEALRGPVDESGPSDHEDLMAWEASLGEAMLVGGDGSSSSSSSLYGDDMELSLAAERAAGAAAGRGVGRRVGAGVGGAGRGRGVVGSGVAGRVGVGARGRSLSSSSAIGAGAGRGRGRVTNPQDRILMEMERKQQEAARRREEEKKRQQEARQQHLKQRASGLVRSTSTSGIERRRTTTANSTGSGVTGNRAVTASSSGTARGTLGSLAGSRSLSQHTASSAMRLTAGAGSSRTAGRVAARPSSPDLSQPGQRKVLSSLGAGPRTVTGGAAGVKGRSRDIVNAVPSAATAASGKEESNVESKQAELADHHQQQQQQQPEGVAAAAAESSDVMLVEDISEDVAATTAAAAASLPASAVDVVAAVEPAATQSATSSAAAAAAASASAPAAAGRARRTVTFQEPETVSSTSRGSNPSAAPGGEQQQQGQEKEREKPGKENKGKEASASTAALGTVAGGVAVGGTAGYHHPPGMLHHSPYGPVPEAGSIATGRRASMEGHDKLGMLNNGVHMTTNAFGYSAPHQNPPAAHMLVQGGGPGSASPAAVGFGEGLREARLKQEKEYLDMLREREAAWAGSEQDSGFEKKKASGLRKLFGGFGK
ncbi:hypothetical protein CLOM_g9222 [Closterium sp. NIES-68]|nr:hypothetical protein CLOM_g9222 [Closterium sp. NIES-68]GJP61412.1 hypothetical protein CLOP_g18580 [Closterium sp. NIES-67]